MKFLKYFALIGLFVSNHTLAQQSIANLPTSGDAVGRSIPCAVPGAVGSTKLCTPQQILAATQAAEQTWTGGQGSQKNTFGTYNNAATSWVIANSNHPAQVLGFVQPSDAALYTDRDSVALYVDNTAPPLVASVPGTFTTTTFVPTTPLSAPVIAQLRVGMLIDTNDATKYTGAITGWATDGTSVTVSGWFSTGNTAAGQTPGGPNALINPITKIWGQNTNVFLPSTGYADTASGYELGIINTKDTTGYTWGFDAINLGTYQVTVGHISRGDMLYGFESQSGAGAGFFFNPSLSSQTGAGFVCAANYGNACFVNMDIPHGNMFSIQGSVLSLGGQAGATTPTMNFYASGTTVIDASVVVGAGTGTNGSGTLALNAKTSTFSGAVQFSGNISGSYPGSLATSGSLTTNFTAGAREVDFWNLDQSGSGWRFYQKTGASSAALAAILDPNGNMTLSGYAYSSYHALGGLTFATLPTCTGGTGAGTIAYITDASAAITAWHQQVTAGGSANKAFVACNGSGWYAFDY